MSDQLWQVIRYVLLIGGGFLAGKGYVTMEQVNTLIDNLPGIIGALTAAGTAIWGLYVKFGTKAVPAATAARPDVPTVSAATGAVQP
ncbi:Pam3-gp28 family putative phage holin [Tardiphaga sp. 866_E4_N2_1]|uniref:Pam3-gp28 family putative phage holin n=1 Tax=unclassified Tardiphaga TaxID=2631404 RepID=UPI003F206A7C